MKNTSTNNHLNNGYTTCTSNCLVKGNLVDKNSNENFSNFNYLKRRTSRALVAQIKGSLLRLFVLVLFSLGVSLNGFGQCTTDNNYTATASTPTCNNQTRTIQGPGHRTTVLGFDQNKVYNLYVNTATANVNCVQARWQNSGGAAIGGWFPLNYANSGTINYGTFVSPSNAARLEITTGKTAWVATSAILNYRLNPSPSADAGPDQVICSGESVGLNGGGAPNPLANASCNGSYTYDCSDYDFINNFSTTGGTTNITNNGSGCSSGAYSNQTNRIVTVMPGGSFNISVYSGNSWSHGHRIWIDWNNDGVFTAAESVWSGGSNTSTQTGTITVPAAQPFGLYRMRVRGQYAAVPGTGDACTALNYGEIEDYTVQVGVIATYSWSGSPIVSGGTTATPTVNPTVTTDYTLTLIPEGCPIDKTTTVTVNTSATPLTTITPPTPSVCSGSNTTLTASGGTTGSNGVIVWQKGTCNTAYEQNWTRQPFGVSSTTVNSVNGILNVTSTSNDPMILMGGLGSYDPAVYRYINIRYRVTAGTAGSTEIFFYNTTHNYAVGGETGYGTLISDGAWHILSIDMHSDPQYLTGGNILGWRYDWATASGVTMDLDFISLDQFPIIAEGASFATPNLTTSTTYYASRRSDCGSTSCISRTITVNNVPAQPSAISGTTTICASVNQTYSVTNVSGVTYTWSYSGTGTLTGTGNSRTLNATTSGTLTVTPSNSCGNGTARSVAITVNNVPAQPSAISGTTTICASVNQVYNVTNVSGVTYTWTYSGTGTLTGTGNSRTLNATTSGTLTVTPSNSCGNGTARTAAITVNNVPAQPSTISGTTTVCSGVNETYSVTNVTGVTYTWTYSGTGNLTGTGNSRTLNATTSGTLTVTPSNTCGNGTARTAAITVNNVPAQPSTISGTTTICSGVNETYSVTNVTGVTYTWTYSGTGNLTGTGNSRTLNATTSGTLTVTPSNTCGNGTARTVAITVNNVPAQPSTISGTTTVCSGVNETYSVTNVTGVSYTWTYSGTGTITGSGNSITLNATTSGTLTVTPSNSCGNGTARSVAITINSVPTATITANNPTICHGNTATLSGTVSIANSVVTINNGVGAVTAVGTNWSVNVTPTATTTYSISSVSSSGCTGTGSGSTTVTLPTAGTTLSGNNESATCYVNGNNYIHFYHSSGRLIASINPNGQDLGNVTATSYIDAGLSVPACDDPTNPNYNTATMGRHWVITPTTQPAVPVLVRLPFGSSEYTTAQTASTSNSNPNDNLTGLASLKLSKYSGTNEDHLFSNNCGNGTTTLWTQSSSGLVNSYISPFNGTDQFASFSIPSFSEFWLHGQTSSPLPVTLTNFSASCDKQVILNWSTASEQNSDRFIVEKSRDGQTWSWVATQTAAGNSNTTLHYTQTDENSWNGLTYYRLRQVDYNGEEEIYGPISVSCEGNENSMTVYPNPNNGSFTIEISSTEIYNNAQLFITDLTGKTIASQTVNVANGTSQVLINDWDLKMGAYLINIDLKGKQAIGMKPIKILVTN